MNQSTEHNRAWQQALLEQAERIAAAGLDPAEYLGGMMQLEQMLVEDPARVIGLLRARYLDDMDDQMGDGAADKAANMPADPPVIDPDDPLAALMAARNEDGAPLFPHVERLRAAMDGLIAGGLATDPETAYGMAERLDEELYRAALSAAVERARAIDGAETPGAADGTPYQKARETRPRRLRSRRALPAGGMSRPTDLDGLIDRALTGAGY